MIKSSSRPLLIVLSSLAAEGCPQLALQLACYWLDQGLHVELISLSDHPTDLLPEFDGLGVPIHNFELGHGLARYPRLVWLSWFLSIRLRPQAVLSFPLGWHAFIALGSRAAGVKRICAHVGNLPPVWTGNAFTKFKQLVQLGRPFTHRLLCCSAYVRDATIRDFAVFPGETRAIFNACDLERFTAESDRLPLPLHAVPCLGMVARLEVHKDQPTLIRAVALLRDQGLETEVWLIGEGSHRPQIESLIDELGLAERVRLLGSRRNIPELLSQLDLFVFSARPDEGFGIALAEAMAAGVPVVASDVGACREVLDGGRCGLLVEPANPDAMAEGIRVLLGDPQRAQELALSARQRALKEFSVAAMADAYAAELGLN